GELMIEIEELCIQYPDRSHPAIDRLTETIAGGEVIVLTGPSGCGKSTLCRALAGFIPEMIPAKVSGEITVDGESVWTADPARVATRLGLIQQDPDAQICTLNVWQEVAFGPENLCLPPSEVAARVEQCLAFVGITHLAERTTTTLSGGEKQRLAIASILAMAPETILLDEPTANLDPEGAQAVFDLLREFRDREDRTLIVVEHRLAPLLPLAPRVLVMNKGGIVTRRATRRHEDLVALGLRAGWDLALPAPSKHGEAAPLLVKDLTFGYDGTPLLDNLSITVEPGEILGIIGPNGGGKTTLLRLIAGLEEPSAGRVVRGRKSVLGYLFQHPHQQIFERTVRGEFAIEGAISDESLRRSLDAANLSGLGSAAPLSLSLGEQRRLTLATTLVRDPDLLLLDEPFIGQDRANVAWIIAKILAARAKGAVTLLVSHDIPLVNSLCDRLLYLGAEPIIGDPRTVSARLQTMGKDAFTPGYWEGETT
ncbi:ATP-binding cassette domain-containing protein, partial [Candidatus Bipolaricaulota bacterium]|nr:ATP-binding cassette domain-containing protein [Candidatus Bipolaricaulota bacterium]